jgi:drug/metabolite transporter (DMT)-like permease
MVPLLSAFSAGELSAVSLKTWAACAIAFAGVVVMGADNDDSGSDASSSDAMLLDLTNSGSNDGTYASQLSHLLHTMSGGDILIVLAALAYSMHVLRLGAYAPRTAPLRLAASKAKAETAFSVSVVLLLAYIGGGVGSGGGGTNAVFSLPEFIVQSGEDVSKYLSWLSSDRNVIDSLVPSIGAILWTGWVTCAYTIYAQSFGQRRVNATNANLIYATQPLFTSLFAYFLLGETLGPNGYVGAALIGTALWLVST